MLAGVDSRGFIFASAMAARLNLGLLLLRKGGKLPPPKIDIEYELEYGLGKLEIKEAQKKGTEIVLIDDILATGGTISAACDLCLKAGYKVKQALVLIDLISIHPEKLTLSNGIRVESLIQLD
jgi:adenine phosphoribosyltransferase